MKLYERQQFEEIAEVFKEERFRLNKLKDLDDINPYTVLDETAQLMARLLSIKGHSFNRDVFLNWTRGIYKDKLK